MRGAPKRASHALPSSPSSLLPTINGRPLHSVHALPSSFYPLLSLLSYRAAEPPCEARSSAPATHYFLLPPLTLLYPHIPHGRIAVRGALKRASHALLSSPSSHSSLSSHTARQNRRARRAQARQPRTTFVSLLSPPYFRIARQNRRARRAQVRQPRTTFFSLLSPLYFPYVYNTSCFGCRHGQPLWWHQADGSHWS